MKAIYTSDRKISTCILIDSCGVVLSVNNVKKNKKMYSLTCLVPNNNLLPLYERIPHAQLLVGLCTLARCAPSSTLFALCLSWWLIIKRALRKKTLFTKMRCLKNIRGWFLGSHSAKIALGRTALFVTMKTRWPSPSISYHYSKAWNLKRACKALQRSLKFKKGIRPCRFLWPDYYITIDYPLHFFASLTVQLMWCKTMGNCWY